MSAAVQRITRLLLLSLCLSAPGFASETQVLPKGTFSVDLSWLHSTIDKQWDGNRKGVSLLEDVRRYEPGGGLQGILHARPQATFDAALVQVLYGITDRLTAILYMPIVINTHINANLSWEPGDFQSQLGRQYSEDDFWQWAASLGQPRVANTWDGNQGRLSDIVLGARYLLPEFEWMEKHHFRWAGTLQVALPTGSNFDPEEPVSVGTNLWELNAAGDVELHATADKQFLIDDPELPRFNIGADLFFAWFRPRQYIAGRGTKNPLLNNIAPYVGDTYLVDPGDWLGAGVSVDAVPIIGPARASIVSGGSLERAQKLPPLLTLSVKYTRIQTGQSDWQSQSPLWDWDREKLWQPGDKNIFRFTATLSLLRLGVPVQVYATYAAQDIVPGKYTRPSNVLSIGARTLLKFW